MNYEDLVNEIIDKTRLGFFPPLKTMSDTDTSDYVLGLNSVPGKITPIYVKWLWLDKILVKIFNPFKKLN